MRRADPRVLCDIERALPDDALRIVARGAKQNRTPPPGLLPLRVHLDAHLVQNNHSDCAGRPTQAGDKLDRASHAMCVDVHFLNDSRRDVEKLDPKLHGQSPPAL
jgi:hypothetical protein